MQVTGLWVWVSEGGDEQPRGSPRDSTVQPLIRRGARFGESDTYCSIFSSRGARLGMIRTIGF
jgi:hypothetical protein